VAGVRLLASLLRDETGATAVEIGLLAPFLIGLVLSIIDLGVYVWDWNQANQAARFAVRLAAISDPVASDLPTLTGLETGAAIGGPVGAYSRVCTTSGCSGGTFDASALDRIYFGPSSDSCDDADENTSLGLCDLMPLAQRSNVTVTYSDSGVDYAGVAGALRPLVTIDIRNIASRSVFLGVAFAHFAHLPPAKATTLAEDMSSST